MILLARSCNAAASLGSNLLGAVFCGFIEYLSMAVGPRALDLLALCLYSCAPLVFLRQSGASVSPSTAETEVWIAIYLESKPR
ncbi:MAG: hypothetical protein JXO72_11360 [Vicinamibacteria bacterium]|nr:hypothetical protein [Vicinamibacteria bacterium]